MKLTKLNLLNFRNYSKIEVIFSDGMNILIGENAQGKTNILESIEILSLTKSHRVNNNPNIIRIGENYCKIRGVVANDYSISRLEFSLNENVKKVKLNQHEIKKISDYISNLNIIIFTPDDLEIIKDSPGIRRNLLNVEISQLSKLYLNTYNEYSKILKTRNEYLKTLFTSQNPNYIYLDAITDKLIEKSIIIYQKRYEYIKLINNKINRYFYEISGFKDLKIRYIPNVEFSSFDSSELAKKLSNIFKNNINKEISYGMTLYGPHRDDFIFEINDTNLKYFGSQGQQKLAILSFKLSEIDIFKKIKNSIPILLFDDIFGELDIKKRNKLLDIIKKECVQSIITTTDINDINEKYLNDSTIYVVENGNIERR